MIYVYDIIVNFQDAKRVYEFFEWRKKDMVEHLKRIPLLRVDSNTLDDMCNNDVKVEREFLDSLYDKTEVYQGNKIKVIPYAILLTDTSRVLAVEFHKNGKNIYKSHLLIDEEEEVLEIADELTCKNIPYAVIKKNKPSFYLTREEEYIQNYLLRELKYTFQKKLDDKIKYLYEEVFDSDDRSILEKYNRLIYEIENNYTSDYKKIYEVLRLAHTKK